MVNTCRPCETGCFGQVGAEQFYPAAWVIMCSILSAVQDITPGGGADTPFSGQRTVTTAGTAVALPATASKSVVIKALTTNTGIIYVGPVGVTSANGFPLRAGETLSMDITNLSPIYINSTVNGESVAYFGVV